MANRLTVFFISSSLLVVFTGCTQGSSSSKSLASVSAARLSTSSASVTADFNSLAANQPIPAGYPIAGFAWPGFQVTEPNDAPTFSTQSISTTSSSSTSGGVSIPAGYVLASFQASNSNSSAQSVIASCSGNSSVTVSLAAGQEKNVSTNWSSPCSVVNFSISGAWSTDLDNLVFMVVNSTQPQPPPSASYSVFTAQVPQGQYSDGSGVNYELGMKFISSQNGSVSAIRFYKGSSESGTHVGKIWSSSGTLLTSVTFANETNSGWQIQNLSTPLSITAGSTYVVSVNTTNTYYEATNYGLKSAAVNGPLSSVVGSNGVYGSRGSFPTKSWESSNYFRDIVFVPASSGSSTSPTPTPTPSLSSRVVPIVATADSGIGVSKVEFYVNNVLTCTETIPSSGTDTYTCPWTVPAGSGISYSLQTVAYDKNSVSTPSQVVHVTSQ